MGEATWLFDDRFAPRVLLCGDLMLDAYFSGEVTRISREAPIPVLRRREIREVLGGAANVAANLAALGARVRACGVVGDDREGQTLRKLLRGHGIEDDLVLTQPGRPTTVKIRLVTDKQQIARVDIEEPADVSTETAERLVELCASALNGPDRAEAVVLSDYAKGVLTARTVPRLIGLAREAGVISVVDPKSPIMSRYRGVTTLIVNRKEAAIAVGSELQSRDDLSQAGQRLLDTTEAEVVVITLGPEGAYFHTRGGRRGVVMSAAKGVSDVTGAGDTLVSAFTLARLTKAPLEEAVKIANAAAGIVVSKPGTATVTRGELAAALGERPSPAKKILEPNELVERLSELRAGGLKIVFTNGCFDVLHVGHLSLLSTARSYGDVLVVGLNSDASAGRNKGDGRPVNGQGNRAALLAALECVGFVSIFEEDLPLELIKRVCPDVLVKGADYTLDQVCGRDFVEGYGGEVKLVPMVEGLSTTKILTGLGKSAPQFRSPRAFR